MNKSRTRNFLLRMGIPGLTPKRLEGENWDLSELNFEGNNLSLLNFEGVKFVGARLIDADLSKSNLRNADFSYADLQRVDFSKADLRGAILLCAKVKGANFEDAKLEETDFTEVNFGKIKLKVPKMRVYQEPKILSPLQSSIYRSYGYLGRVYWTVSYYYSRFLTKKHKDGDNG